MQTNISSSKVTSAHVPLNLLWGFLPPPPTFLVYVYACVWKYIYFVYFLLTVVWIINPALQDKREMDDALKVPLQPGGD